MTIQIPGAPSLAFLTYLCAVLPYAAWKSAAIEKGAQPGRPAPTREQIWRGTCFQLIILFVLAWVTGRGFGFEIFSLPEVGLREIAWTLGAFALVFLVREVLRRSLAPDELRRLAVFRRAARTPREIAFYSLAAILAGVAEEAAYRGVGWAILIYSVGDPWSTALFLSLVFALAHWSLGWKSGVAILLIALIFHGLVVLTDTLVLAMIVHALYDLIVGWRIRKQALEFDRAGVDASVGSGTP